MGELELMGVHEDGASTAFEVDESCIHCIPTND